MNARRPFLTLLLGVSLTLLAAAPALAAGPGTSALEPLPDLDNRPGSVAPTSDQLALVKRLEARAEWNRFGTPSSLVKHGGFLENRVAGANAEAAARSWISANKALFGLASTDGLALETDSPLVGSAGHAVTFRQEFGGVPAGQDGLLTVGLTGSSSGWKVAYVSSSVSPNTTLAGSASLSAVQAWLLAASNVGRGSTIASVSDVTTERGWTVFRVAGFAMTQRARLRAIPTPGGAPVPAFETIVVQGSAAPVGYKHFVDARNGNVLVREDLVEQAQAPQSFNGDFGPADGGCGSDHTFMVPANTYAIDIVATATLPANDIVLHLKKDGVIVASADTATSPEAIHYDLGAPLPIGTYAAQVCEYTDSAAPLPPTTYSGTIVVNDVASTSVGLSPRWKLFPANPPLSALPADPWGNPSTDTRQTWCWNITNLPVVGCDREINNEASRAPWDYNPKTSSPSYTTLGNNASSAEAWANPPTVQFGNITPGATGYRPISPQRNYVYPWTNAWFNADCSPSVFTPFTGNDIDAAVTNLFVMHNRMHDWSYSLGFTERNYNLQLSNFGNTSPDRENDPVTGSAQSGAVTGGAPAYGGRDNANMLTLPDGVGAITNMYLWQPLAGAFYAPCVDGDYDMGIIGHEYGHAIENRMIGKGGNRSGHHAGAMGESHGDLMAMEYLNEYGFVPTDGENPYAVGTYATGNKERAIRNFGMNYPRSGPAPSAGVTPAVNALNFSDMGYDITGGQVHADGEIWSATNFDVRQALVDKYAATFPASNAGLQRECAEGKRPADQCPGNRRWMQLVFDSYLLMPVAPSMLQARDAQLAADVMRFGGANQDEIWLAFARRGFGESAFSTNTLSNDDSDPKPDFASPRQDEAAITFRAVGADENGAPVNARIYVGQYEARVSPIAVAGTAAAGEPGASNLDELASFVPGTYELIAHAPGYGVVRFRETFTAGGSRTVTVPMSTNRASGTKGATATGDGTGHANLIDDTEATNWARTSAPSIAGSQVTVDLQGDAQSVARVQVSAMLAPGNNRFVALRQFEIQTCLASTTNAACTAPGAFTSRLTSPENAFPGVTPRPASPDLILRSFALPQAVQATHVRIVVLTNQCTGTPAFQGEQDADPANATDCRTGSTGTVNLIGDLPGLLGPRDNEVRIAELQVFSPAAPVVAPKPDLVVSDIVLTAGKKTTRVTATVANTGAAAAGPSQTELLVVGGQVLCLLATPGLAAGAQTDVNCDFTPRGAKTTKSITATADKPAQVDESSETNNTRTEAFVF